MNSEKRTFLNMSPPFNSSKFELWKTRFKIFLKSNSYELWEKLINVSFIHTHQVNGEVIDKLWIFWTEEEKIKFEIYFKTNKFKVMSLDDTKILYVHNFKTFKEMWDILEIIYGFYPSIEQEEMKTWGAEDEDIIFNFKKNRNIGSCIGVFVTNQFLRVKNWKFNPIIKSKDKSLHEFHEKSRNKEIIEKLNDLIKLLKDEGTKTKESTT